MERRNRTIGWMVGSSDAIERPDRTVELSDGIEWWNRRRNQAMELKLVTPMDSTVDSTTELVVESRVESMAEATMESSDRIEGRSEP